MKRRKANLASRTGRRSLGSFEPLEPRVVLDSTVVFNEIMYHPVDNEPALEWIELYNQMSVDIDLSGWRLAGGVDFEFTEGTLLSGGDYLVVTIDPVALQQATGFDDALGPFTGRLANGGEEIRLVDNDRRVMDTLDYRDSGDWPVAPDGSGASLAKRELNASSEAPQNWSASLQVGGTLGGQNFADAATMLETVIASGDNASYLVPSDDSLGVDWTTIGFDDSSWSSGPTGVGYDTVALVYSDEVLADNPVGYWRFEETSGAVAADSSGNGNDANIVGGVTLGADGALGVTGDRAMEFDGATGHIQLPGTWGDGWTELTIEAWVYTEQPITGDFQSVVSGHNPSAFAHFQLHSGGNSGVYTNAGFVATPIVPATPTGQWRHVAITSRSGESIVYVDGQQLGSANGAAYSSITASGNVSIGLGHAGGRWFHGRIDEVAIYDTALPAERIELHHLAGVAATDPNPTNTELLAHWTFDTDATDQAGTHDGALGGGASITGESIVGGGALDLRDVNGYVDIPSTVLDQETSFTIAYWISADTLESICCSSVYANDSWSPGKLRVNVDTATGQAELGVNGNSSFPRSVAAIPADSSWIHVAWTYDAGAQTVTSYIDGQPELATVLDTAALVGVGPATIGAWDATGGGLHTRFLDGRLDDLQIYRGLLSETEIGDLAALGGGSPAGDSPGGGAGSTSTPISAFGVIQTDIQQEMFETNSSAYLRSSFVLASAAAVDQLTLKMKYDDGFVAYLNGVEVARRNAPVSVSFDSAATSVRDNQDAVTFEHIDLAGSIGALVDGVNVLAIQGLNAAADDEDFLILPELELHQRDPQQPPLALNEVAGVAEGNFSFELANFGDTEIVLDGFSVASSADLNNPFVFTNATLPAGGYLTVTQPQIGFQVADEDRLFLYTPDGLSVVDAAVVENSRRARMPDATGRWLRPSAATPNGANQFQLHNEIVINEIMYHHRPTLATPGTPDVVELTNLLPIDATWKYDASGADLGTAWREPGFDDTLWSSGGGLLGFETNPNALPEPLGTFVTPHNGLTYYFRTEFEFTGDPQTAVLSLQTVIDDGAIIYLNGMELHRIGMDAGAATAATPAGRTVADAVYEGPFNVPTAALVVGQNTLAVEVHQWGATSSDMIMGVELSLEGDVIPGTPGTPYVPSDEEWIELFNRGDSAVDLSGWRLDDAIDYTFAPGVTIGAGEYLVVARDAAALAAKYPTIDIVGDYSGRLSNSNERIELKDGIGNPADEVEYFDDGRWPYEADGAGASLELIDPDTDNAHAESWAPSDESANSQWVEFSYRGFAGTDIGPTNFQELIVGLLDAGEALIDDVSVVENPDRPDARQLIQNGEFESGAAGAWRLLGNHSGSQVVADPDDPANQALRLVSSGPMDHLGNHLETTLKDGNTFVTISSSREYEISFRAKWLSGSRQLRTNLYFNRLARVSILQADPLHGTPGGPNSTLVVNAGPTYENLSHTPAVPEIGEPVTVAVSAADPDGVAGLTLWYSVDGGAFVNLAMNDNGQGDYSATVPGQAASAVVQFYVEGQDTLGASSTFPADGDQSRALYKVQDNQAQLGEVHNLRIIMTAADADLLHANFNLMSNDPLGATIIYDETEVFYDVGVRMKGSTFGRTADQFVSYIVQFHPDHKFRGVHDSVAIDRSARGPVGSPNVDELLIKQAFNHAGGVASNYDDIIRVIAPRHTSVAQLNMARYGDVFLDAQFDNGGDHPVFEFDGAYYASTTSGGGPEDFKFIQPNGISYTDIRDLGDDKEAYRYNWIIKDNRDEDDFSYILELNEAFSLNGSQLDDAIGDVIDVNQWARHYAMLSLTGVSDTYTHGNPHNLRVYRRPEDGRIISLPHDMDTSFQRATSSPLIGGSQWNLVKIFQRPQFVRLFYGNLQDLIATTYNSAYMSHWTDHYADLAGSNFDGILGYITARASFVTNQLATVAPQIPFEITTNGGNDFSIDSPTVTLEGDGWINVREIRLAGSDEPLDVTWLDEDSWQADVALQVGANLIELEAFNYQGAQVGADSITVTTSTTNPVGDFLRITEIMYHPADPTPAEQAAGVTDDDEFEYVELMNTSDTVTLDLTGVEFNNGIDFDFTGSAVTSLAPGERVLAVRNLAAFAERYDTTGMLIAGEYRDPITGGNRLANGGDTLRLVDANQATIHDFRYDDKTSEGWYDETDGPGRSLVIVDATALVDNWSLPGGWTASGETLGSPGATGSLLGDFNSDTVVGVGDIARLQSNLGATGATHTDGDHTGDGAVGRQDIASLFRFYGRRYEAPNGPSSPSAPAAIVREVVTTDHSNRRLTQDTTLNREITNQLVDAVHAPAETNSVRESQASLGQSRSKSYRSARAVDSESDSTSRIDRLFADAESDSMFLGRIKRLQSRSTTRAAAAS